MSITKCIWEPRLQCTNASNVNMSQILLALVIFLILLPRVLHLLSTMLSLKFEVFHVFQHIWSESLLHRNINGEMVQSVFYFCFACPIRSNRSMRDNRETTKLRMCNEREITCKQSIYFHYAQQQIKTKTRIKTNNKKFQMQFYTHRKWWWWTRARNWMWSWTILFSKRLFSCITCWLQCEYQPLSHENRLISYTKNYFWKLRCWCVQIRERRIRRNCDLIPNVVSLAFYFNVNNICSFNFNFVLESMCCSIHTYYIYTPFLLELIMMAFPFAFHLLFDLWRPDLLCNRQRRKRNRDQGDCLPLLFQKEKKPWKCLYMWALNGYSQNTPSPPHPPKEIENALYFRSKYHLAQLYRFDLRMQTTPFSIVIMIVIHLYSLVDSF